MLQPELAKISQTLQETSFPKKFAVEITAHCNFACSMCHHPNMKRPKGRMPFELWKKCADQIAVHSPRTECWFSFCGEPLLEPELLLQILAYGKAVGLQSLNVNSNGMLLTRDIAARMLDSGADLIVFGLDGFTRQTYERIRIGGDRDVVYANVEYLLRQRQARPSGPEIQVQFIEMDENSHEMEAFSAHWLERGATLKLRNKLSWGGRFDTPALHPRRRSHCLPLGNDANAHFMGRANPALPRRYRGRRGRGQRLGRTDYRVVEVFGRLPRPPHETRVRQAARALPEVQGLDGRRGEESSHDTGADQQCLESLLMGMEPGKR